VTVCRSITFLHLSLTVQVFSPAPKAVEFTFLPITAHRGMRSTTV
jgi:uncharacterized protein YpbB